ncbi:MAG: hypothetical protein DMF61_00885 [Blastocatellia bacterium AA13]|nr:MAG: hypothetical protein DMF61_00885 [Blastocatellia bacterium AA13]
MNTDSRDILDVLKSELQFLERGGYGRSVRTPWQPTSVFLDSLSCINYGDPNRTLPCDQCMLSTLVSSEGLKETLPCHHIPLNEHGDTIQLLEDRGDQEKLVETVKDWLRRSIDRIEKERGKITCDWPAAAS